MILHKRLNVFILMNLGLFFFLVAPVLEAKPLKKIGNFGGNPGALNMYVYEPENMPDNAPLVVALHGCVQDAEIYTNSGWNSLADEWKFYVLYPEQNSSNNSMKCFNWAGEYGNPANLQRGKGENLSIIQMIDKMKELYSINENSIFVTGFSGGGAQAALMMAAWPDVFSAGAILSGVPYYCTDVYFEVSQCVFSGKSRSPGSWGDLVRNAFPGFSAMYPRVSIWHSQNDSVVSPVNQGENLKQWTNVHGIDQDPDSSDMVNGYLHEEYRDDSGVTLIETYTLKGVGHGLPVDPANGCGNTASYIVDAGICSSYYIGKFFGLYKD